MIRSDPDMVTIIKIVENVIFRKLILEVAGRGLNYLSALFTRVKFALYIGMEFKLKFLDIFVGKSMFHKSY